jgi:methylmalonyl-CoA/ethylmalonyl-CoA epimerase
MESTTSDLTGIGAVFDHVAIAASRIRDLLPIYADLLGGRFTEGGDNARVGYRALHLGFADGSKVELMEPLPGSRFLDSFFRRTGAGGLHHITFKVPDMDKALRRLQDLGYTPTGLYLDDPYWQEAFLHPKHAYGTLVQIAHAPQPFPVPEGLTLDDVLAGNGEQGTGVASP